jgi:23S rRNA U2552 (ribose-2'-O)-methylase RlmE/FtsJ
MITFSEFYKNIEPKSDKGTLHDYIDGYYSNEFTNRRLEKLSILEIGVRRGDSLNLLSKWFTNSDIIGIDNGSEMNHSNIEFIKTLSNTKLFLENAYVDSIINKFQDNSIDYIIDDGPHTLESQLYSINNWYKKIKMGGKLIIEDIQSLTNLNLLIIVINDLNYDYNVFDLRESKNRYDDIIIEIIKK